MIDEVTKKDLINACRVLFDQRNAFNSEFFNNLDIADLKLAYRKKAFETHPDRSRMLGISEAIMNARFKQVTSAYEFLTPLISNKIKIFRSDPHDNHTDSPLNNKPQASAFSQPRSGSPLNNHKDRFYSGELPRYELLLGQFLYYSGQISWKMLIDAIVWQRRQRPLFGEIANQWGILTQKEIQYIIARRQVKEKIGQYAIRTGLITPFQHMAIMGKQRRMQMPIGKYFTDRHILSLFQMDRLIRKMKLHNDIFKK